MYHPCCCIKSSRMASESDGTVSWLNHQFDFNRSPETGVGCHFEVTHPHHPAHKSLDKVWTMWFEVSWVVDLDSEWWCKYFPWRQWNDLTIGVPTTGLGGKLVNKYRLTCVAWWLLAGWVGKGHERRKGQQIRLVYMVRRSAFDEKDAAWRKLPCSMLQENA